MVICLERWSEVQTCIWLSWCHCHSLSLASVKSRLVLPFLVLAQPGSPGQRSVKRVFCLFSWLCNEIDWFIVMVKVKCADIAVRILSCHGNSHAIWDPAVLPATRQRWHSRLYPSRSWYSIKRWPTCPYPFFYTLLIRRHHYLQVSSVPISVWTRGHYSTGSP